MDAQDSSGFFALNLLIWKRGISHCGLQGTALAFYRLI